VHKIENNIAYTKKIYFLSSELKLVDDRKNNIAGRGKKSNKEPGVQK
jgi:hypothetical protein